MPAQTQEQLQQLAKQIAESETRLSALLADKATLSRQLELAREEIAAIKQQNAATPDAHNYSETIVARYYQTRCLRRIGEAFETDHDRKTLVVMATGAGKTRTVIALCDLLMRCHWAKRVLFLADRVALVNQAVNAFKKFLPQSSPVNLVTESDTDGRVMVCTYPTMMGLIDEMSGDQRRFGVGHFDLIVIDEAHRSVYQKYGAIFRYFDSLLVGLTATPREEVDRDTYALFDLEKGVPTAMSELAHHVAGLPTELESEDEEAKRFDLLLLNLQLAGLRAEPSFERLKAQVMAIAGLLEEKSSIPMVQARLINILEIQTDEWWRDITVTMLEQTRKSLRLLVKLIDRRQRKPSYTDFEDSMGDGVAVDLPEFTSADGFEKFREKARVFLRAHQDQIAIQKLRFNQPLTALDLNELERIMIESGAARPEHLTRAKEESQSLGLFVRSLVGRDRQAAKEALGAFTRAGQASANQIEFVNLIVDHLTEHGAMDAAQLYESPFTDLNSQGPDRIFSPAQVGEQVAVRERIRDRAMA